MRSFLRLKPGPSTDSRSSTYAFYEPWKAPALGFVICAWNRAQAATGFWAPSSTSCIYNLKAFALEIFNSLYDLLKLGLGRCSPYQSFRIAAYKTPRAAAYHRTATSLQTVEPRLSQ